MYRDVINSADKALVHLAFHCCLKDGRLEKAEVDLVAEKLVTVGLHTKLNFKNEIVKYRSYQAAITDDTAYVRYLLQLIRPVSELALLSYCAELCVGDAELSIEEEKLLDIIAAELKITPAEREVVKKIAAQRKVVETQKVF